MKINIKVIIPSRYGSKRFEGKPLALIEGKPLIQRVYENAIKSDAASDVIVATDDMRIAETVKNFGGKYILTYKNHESGTDRAAEAAAIAGFDMNDVIVNVQGDQPFLNPICISEVTKPFIDGFDEMSTLVYKMTDNNGYKNPHDVKAVLDNKNFAIYFSRSPLPYYSDKSRELIFYKHLGVYAYKRIFLEKFTSTPCGNLEKIEKLEQLRALEYGFKIKAIITGYDSPAIDIPEDIKKAELFIKNKN